MPVNKRDRITSDAPKVADATSEKELGVIVSVSGPVVVADNMLGAAMYEQVRVGPEELLGEVIRLEGETATLQVYEETTGLTVGDLVRRAHKPFSLELGPGIMGETFDGIQRPLHTIAAKVGSAFIPRGVTAPSLDRKKLWEFTPLPSVKEGSRLSGGDVFGLVYENKMITHKVMVPPHALGRVSYLAEAGSYNVDEELLELEFHGKKQTFTMVQIWPVRQPRPAAKRLTTEAPLVTGQRVLDVMCPTVQGGTTALPGPFGCGKCLGKDTPILMADGSFKMSQDVVVGDKIMGDDGSVRMVLELDHNNTEVIEAKTKEQRMEQAQSLHNANTERSTEEFYDSIKEQMHEVTIKSSRGTDVKFTCNTSHVLSVHWTGNPRMQQTEGQFEVPYVVEENGIATEVKLEQFVVEGDNQSEGHFTTKALIEEMATRHANGEEVYLCDYKEGLPKHRVLFASSKFDMSVGDFNLLTQHIKSFIKGYHMAGVTEFHGRSFDGNYEDVEIANVERIPEHLKYGSVEARRGVLGGIIDAHGSLNEDARQFEVKLQSESLFDDVVFVARSLGMYASYGQDEHHVLIGGNVSQLCDHIVASTKKPQLVQEPAHQKPKTEANVDEDPMYGALEVRPLGHGDFYGFSVDGNHRFVINKEFVVTHNSVISQAVSKWSNSDGIVYCATGERGNEVAEVLEDFPELTIPIKDENGVEHQEPVMQRTTLIANTSNMPIAARELSIYTAISIAEYYRDMGMNISLMADSTSRWAEALREQGSRLGEMPADGGYPAYLGQRLAAFYERAGRVQCLGSPDRQGSVTVIGAVSPAGGDFSDAVVQSTLSVVQVFWALDRQLAARKHFPAINTSLSYTKYEDVLNGYYKDIEPTFMKMRATTQQILQKEEELMSIVQLIGRDSLAEADKALLDVASLIRNDFLMQNSYTPYDKYCPLYKSVAMLKCLLRFHEMTQAALAKQDAAGRQMQYVTLRQATEEIRHRLTQMKFVNTFELGEDAAREEFARLLNDIEETFDNLAV